MLGNVTWVEEPSQMCCAEFENSWEIGRKMPHQKLYLCKVGTGECKSYDECSADALVIPLAI